jgi:hypothetical protein
VGGGRSKEARLSHWPVGAKARVLVEEAVAGEAVRALVWDLAEHSGTEAEPPLPG